MRFIKIKKVTKTLANFIGKRSMIKALLTFGTGFYFGLYAAQSHSDKVPIVVDPTELARRVRDWIDEATKPRPK